MRYIFGIIIIGLCVLVVWKSSRLGEMFPIPWAEQKFSSAGMAGTITFLRLVAILIMIGTILYMFGALQAIIVGIFT